jgi:predicted negative regulator of RcsB-dependent stress response
MDTKQYNLLIDQSNKLLKGYGPQSELLTFKGLAQKELGELGNASLTFEQSLKYNNSKKGVSKSLYELVKIKMEERDFYAAYHTISRAEHLHVDQSIIDRFRIFNEAAVFLMKRKFEEGLKLLEVMKGDNIDVFMGPLLKRFKGYALFCLGKHE